MASSNHPLQDYQMQLMLLERQNKKRLMRARQEIGEGTNADCSSLLPTPPQSDEPERWSPSEMSGSNSKSSYLITPNPSPQPVCGPLNLQLELAPSDGTFGSADGGVPAKSVYLHGSMATVAETAPRSTVYPPDTAYLPGALYLPDAVYQQALDFETTMRSNFPQASGYACPVTHPVEAFSIDRHAGPPMNDSGYSISMSRVPSNGSGQLVNKQCEPLELQPKARAHLATYAAHFQKSLQDAQKVRADLEYYVPYNVNLGPDTAMGRDSDIVSSPPSNVSMTSSRGSCVSRDSGYATDSRIERREKELKDKHRSKSPRRLDFDNTRGTNSQKSKIPRQPAVHTPRDTSIQPNSPLYNITNNSDVSCEIISESTLPEQVMEQIPQALILDVPLNNDADSHIDDVDLAVDDMDFSRSPSPWQTANSTESEQSLVQSLWWIVNGMNDDSLGSQTSVNSSPRNYGTGSPVVLSVEGATDHAAGYVTGSSSISGAAVAHPDSNNSTTSTDPQGVKRKRGLNDPTRDSDDGDENEPNRKRLIPTTPERPFLRPRFACPYQKYDPWGTPFCCMPSTKNPEGGADTFPRIKSHIFRNHDPFMRCRNCWKMCKTEQEAQIHHSETKCIPKASPGKYWITREQRDQVRQRKFVSSNTDNWFCLFGILLPDVPADGPNGYKRLSPYYIASPPGPPTPAPSSGGSGNRSTSGGRAVSLDPTPPTAQQPTESFIASQPVVTHFQDVSNSDTSFSTFLDSEIDHALRWGDSGTFDGPIDQPSQPHTGDNPEFYSRPIAAPIGNFPITPPDPGQPNPFRFDQPANQNSNFLWQDNMRLRNNNDQLQDEVETLRRQHSEMQAQLDEFRNRMRPLDRSLQELLYLPDIQNGDIGVSGRIFTILDEMIAINMVLSSGASKK